jgi:hypothetical protein
MNFLIAVLIITTIIIPVLLVILRVLYKKWCLAVKDKKKSEELLWSMELVLRALMLDLLVLIWILMFVIELGRR